MLTIKQCIYQNKSHFVAFLAQLLRPFTLLNPFPMQSKTSTVGNPRIYTNYLSSSSFFKIFLFVLSCYFVNALEGCNNLYSNVEKKAALKGDSTKKDSAIVAAVPLVLDTALYNEKMVRIVNGDSSGRWPVKTAYPEAGAILPFKRIVAYYGNLYSKKMGVLGEYP